MKTKKTKKKPFAAFLYADWVTWKCPCGQEVTGEGNVIHEFIRQHVPHTNKKCVETLTDDGARFVTWGKRRVRTFTVKI
jgi:hypothetical protein